MISLFWFLGYCYIIVITYNFCQTEVQGKGVGSQNENISLKNIISLCLIKDKNSDHQSNEVMAVGINAVREICARCPLAMEKDLLQV